MKQKLSSLVAGVRFKFVNDIDNFCTKDDWILKYDSSENRYYSRYSLKNERSGNHVYAIDYEGRTVEVDLESFREACRSSFVERDSKLLWIVEEVVEKLGAEHCAYFRKDNQIYFKYKSKTGFHIKSSEFRFTDGRLKVNDSNNSDMFYLDSVVGLLVWSSKKRVNEL